MHPNAHPPDDLSNLERRLASWQPADEGLEADAMLFAAGRASVRPRATRLLWPALACAMTVVTLFLGVCLKSERDERVALARLLEQQAPVPPPAPSPVAEPPAPVEALSPSSLLAAQHALEQGLDAWPPSTATPAPDPGPPPTADPVLQVRRLDLVLGP
jgi:hypothetical protein